MPGYGGVRARPLRGGRAQRPARWSPARPGRVLTGQLVRASATGIGAPTGWAGSVLPTEPARPDRMPWQVYEVRRVIRPGPTTPPARRTPPRSLHAAAAGNRTQMTAVRRKMAKAEGAGIQDEDGSSGPGCAAAARHSRPPGTSWSPPPPDHWTRTAPASRQPGRRQHPRPAPGPRTRPEYGMGADSGFQPSVPRLSVAPVCYGCKACDWEADRAVGGRC